MNDLSGLQWQASSSNNGSSANTRQPPVGQASNPTPPISRGPTPGSGNVKAPPPANSSTSRGPSKASSPANDSFASLLSSKTPKSSNSLSLQERQTQLLEEKARQQDEQRKRYEAQYGFGKSDVWDSLGSSKSTPQPPAANRGDGDDDILSAFNSAAPVDSSSYFPPPKATADPPGSRTSSQNDRNTTEELTGPGGNGHIQKDDDDPFGLGAMATKSAAVSSTQWNPQQSADPEDDVLGLLGKPVSEIELDRRKDESPGIKSESLSNDAPKRADPYDKAVADLVDMGFPAEKSREALSETANGLDVQAAVGLLLNRAHEEARQKTRDGSLHGADPNPVKRPSDAAVPTWMRSDGSRTTSRSSSAQRRQDNRSPTGEKDVTQYASEFGTNLFKSANTLWKTGQKRVQKVVAELQQDPDPSQPKWMREAGSQAEIETRSSGARGGSQSGSAERDDLPKAAAHVTDEALLLESDTARPQKPIKAQPSPARTPTDLPRVMSPAQGLADRTGLSQRSSSPQWQQRRPERDIKANLTRQAIEDQSSQAYVSPARRKKVKPVEDLSQIRADSYQPQSSQRSALANDPPKLAPLSSNNPYSQVPSSKSTVKPVSPLPTRPTPAPRNIPSIFPSALLTSSSHRQRGSEAFKRGDYVAAHESYSAALRPVPSNHPLTIVILCNRALTSLKTGDPKAALADCETVVSTIGPARGEGEVISLGSGEGDKDMRDFWGKAVMRKAEALENMEKWNDAAAAWRLAVEAGVGGVISLQGRNRCEKAAAPRPTPPSKPAQSQKKPPTPKKRAPSALDELSGRPPLTSASSAAAVKKLREQNAALERADDERFALTDQVDAKLAAWKGGKADNLRALLGSLDTVLWSDAGWKKVGMSDLVMPNKVKIVYMKAIAKVHPDKVCSVRLLSPSSVGY